MPTKNPRVNVVLDPEIYGLLSKLAQSQGISLSLFSRDLIKEALEIREDIYWQNEAEKRENTFSAKKPLFHKDVWK
ncbi:MAG: antitoxin, RHH family protein [Candidatus Omnitrophica bacterium]|nr:antitoxin, RHH family protein [Candidatus Omnitrophota bacterium]MBU4478922.1 antitoxin, RHH family protein [Candidatus Omnitrophota bacterium]MCG2704381.1 antitoxin, RHH family protein [Candidatus Omnitrophota bacterium]